jgi:selenium metabolism protein YedF
MQNLISVLPELGDDLWRIILLNGGVKLAIEGSPVLERLQDLENKGVSILVCGTCLDHFKILENKQVGETTNMLDVVTSMQLADKVLRV